MMCFRPDRKSTRLNSSHLVISYAVFCLKKKDTNYSCRDTECTVTRERYTMCVGLTTLYYPQPLSATNYVLLLLSLLFFFFFFFLIMRPPPISPLFPPPFFSR